MLGGCRVGWVVQGWEPVGYRLEESLGMLVTLSSCYSEEQWDWGSRGAPVNMAPAASLSVKLHSQVSVLLTTHIALCPGYVSKRAK